VYRRTFCDFFVMNSSRRKSCVERKEDVRAQKLDGKVENLAIRCYQPTKLKSCETPPVLTNELFLLHSLFLCDSLYLPYQIFCANCLVE